MSTEVEAKPQSDLPVEASDVSETNDAAPTNKRKAVDAASTNVPELEVDLSLPEPPSKRAKRALKKGKVLPPKGNNPANNADASADTDKSGKPAGKESKERSQFGIWIGNLPFTVTRPQLFKWLIDSSGGAIAETDITRVNLPTSGRKGRPPPPPRGAAAETEAATGPQNKGFAYVDFATYEAQVAATALSETELAGRRVLIKDSKSFEGRPKPVVADGMGAGNTANGAAPSGSSAAAAVAATGCTKVFVGNLGFDTTEDDLRQQFSPCGHIAWAKVATFPDNTEKCRGYGWVQFGVEKAAADEGDEDDEDEDSKNKSKSAETATATPAEAAASAVKGFVRIKETIDTEDDFVAEAEATGEANEDEAEAKPKQPPRTKTRKWWVNMLKGRMLKIQFAEDDQTRYKKRFGKDRPRKEEEGQQQRRPRQDKRQNTDARQEAAAATVDSTANKPYKLQDLSIAQRTGAVTASLGKKTILE